VLFTCRVPSLWAQVEVEAGQCRVESGVLGNAADGARTGSGSGARGGGRDRQPPDILDAPDSKRVKLKSEHGEVDTVPDASQVAAAAAVVYQAVLEQVVLV
jgi:hypothetical protein